MSGSKWGFGMMIRMRKRALGRKKIEKKYSLEKYSWEKGERRIKSKVEIHKENC